MMIIFSPYNLQIVTSSTWIITYDNYHFMRWIQKAFPFHHENFPLSEFHLPQSYHLHRSPFIPFSHIIIMTTTLFMKSYHFVHFNVGCVFWFPMKREKEGKSFTKQILVYLCIQSLFCELLSLDKSSECLIDGEERERTRI